MVKLSPPPHTQVIRASRLPKPRLVSKASLWELNNLTGRLIELAQDLASGALSRAIGLIGRVQDEGKFAAWISLGQSYFFPPDLLGLIDLDELPLIRTTSLKDLLFGLEVLLKSAFFSLIVVDLDRQSKLNEGDLGRIMKLAVEYHAAVIFLTRKTHSSPSLGSLISLRADIGPSSGGPLTHQLVVTKDKFSNSNPLEVVKLNAPRGLP